MVPQVACSPTSCSEQGQLLRSDSVAQGGETPIIQIKLLWQIKKKGQRQASYKIKLLISHLLSKWSQQHHSDRTPGIFKVPFFQILLCNNLILFYLNKPSASDFPSPQIKIWIFRCYVYLHRRKALSGLILLKI